MVLRELAMDCVAAALLTGLPGTGARSSRRATCTHTAASKAMAALALPTANSLDSRSIAKNSGINPDRAESDCGALADADTSKMAGLRTSGNRSGITTPINDSSGLCAAVTTGPSTSCENKKPCTVCAGIKIRQGAFTMTLALSIATSPDPAVSSKIWMNASCLWGRMFQL